MEYFKLVKGNKKNFEQFLTFFKKSLGELFPHFSVNVINFTIDVDYEHNWLLDKLVSDKKTVYLAFHKEEIVGYLLCSRAIAGVAYADWLAIDKKYQKKGIASKFITMWEKECLKNGTHALYLWTSNDVNVRFYKNRGFSLGGQFPKAWHGHDSYLMYKIIMEPKEENFLRNYLKSKKK